MSAANTVTDQPSADTVDDLDQSPSGVCMEKSVGCKKQRGDSSLWKKNIAKRKRNNGEKYVDRAGNIVSAVIFKDYDCKCPLNVPINCLVFKGFTCLSYTGIHRGRQNWHLFLVMCSRLGPASGIQRRKINHVDKKRECFTLSQKSY